MKKLAVNKIIISLLTLIALCSSGYLIYMILLLNRIEDTGRFLVIGIILLLSLYAFLEYRRILRNKKRHQSHKLYTILIIVLLIITSCGSLAIRKLYQTIDSVNQSTATYSTSLVALKNTKLDDVKTIGIIENETSIEGYKISQSIIKENKLKQDLKKYAGFSELMAALYAKEVDAIFISSSYVSMFDTNENYKNISSETVSLITKSENQEKEKIVSTKSITEPFSVLLMGVDSTSDGLSSTASANGDTLILLTINPNTLSITMVSIPRDSYVPIACFANQKENKITHAAWNGTQCMIDTIRNYFDISIDYYVKINFKGVVGLVDALGGVKIDVPKRVCTGDSDRKKMICMDPGLQILDGEHTLAFARNRKMISGGDFGREQNQQKVIMSMLESAKKISSIDQVSKILNTISKNIDTNFSNNQILSFYELFKTILINNQNLKIEQMLLIGDSQVIYDEGMQLPLWNYILNKNSVKDVENAMKINLELIKPEMIKSFVFNSDDPITTKKTGSGPYSGNSLYSLLPNFTKYSKENAIAWANNNNFSMHFTNVVDVEKENGTIISQSIPGTKRLDLITSKVITLTIVENPTVPIESAKETEPIEDEEQIDEDNQIEETEE